jgi:nucleoprotein TPR
LYCLSFSQGSKIEVIQAESTRVKSQLEVKTKQLEETQAELSKERTKEHTESATSVRYADLLQKVQTVSALADSNRMLREEKLKLTEELNGVKQRLTIAEDNLKPLQEKLKGLAEKYNASTAEIQSLKLDNTMWKDRANQLIEKQQKISPEELKKLQEQNSTLNKQLSALNARFTQLQQASASTGNRLKAVQATLDKANADLTQRSNELVKANQELQKWRGVNQRNTQVYSSKIADMEASNKRLQGEKDALQQELAKERASKTSDVEDQRKVATDLKAQLDTKDKELTAANAKAAELRNTVQKLRALARNFKEAKEKLEAEMKSLKDGTNLAGVSDTSEMAAKLATLEEDNKKLKEENAKHLTMLEEALKSVEDMEAKVSEYDSLKEEHEQLSREFKAAKVKEEKFKSILTRLKENKDNPQSGMAAEAMERKKAEEELEETKRKHEADVKGLTEEKKKLQSAFQTQKEDLEGKIQTLRMELNKKMANTPTSSGAPAAMPTEKPLPETVSVKPMAGAAPTKPKQPIQPQAHIQPHQRQPATATIRPQRGSAAVIRTTTANQSPSSEVPQVTVQPTIVTMASVAQSTVVTPALNPSAQEFVPRTAPIVALHPAAQGTLQTMVTSQPVEATHREDTTEEDRQRPWSTAQENQEEDSQVEGASVPSDPQPQPGPSGLQATKRPRDEGTEEVTPAAESKRAKTTEEATATEVVVLGDDEEQGEEEDEEADQEDVAQVEEDEQDEDEGEEEEAAEEGEDDADGGEGEEAEEVENEDEETEGQQVEGDDEDVVEIVDDDEGNEANEVEEVEEGEVEDEATVGQEETTEMEDAEEISQEEMDTGAGPEDDQAAVSVIYNIFFVSRFFKFYKPIFRVEKQATAAFPKATLWPPPTLKMGRKWPPFLSAKVTPTKASERWTRMPYSSPLRPPLLRLRPSISQIRMSQHKSLHRSVAKGN